MWLHGMYFVGELDVILTRARSRERARRAAGVERSDWALVKVKLDGTLVTCQKAKILDDVHCYMLLMTYSCNLQFSNLRHL